MKKTFLARRNAILSSATLSWGAGALIFSVFTLLFRLVAPDMFWNVFTPTFRVSDLISAQTHSFLSRFQNAAMLSSANQDLANRNMALANENDALREKIDVIALWQSARGSGVVAGVVAGPPVSPYDTLVVAAGTEEGVGIGMEAFGLISGDTIAGGVPIGVVTQTGKSFSKITLFSSPHVQTVGWVGPNHLSVLIEGGGGGTMSMSSPRSAGIAKGDLVYVPGPGMLPIGHVSRIESDPALPSVKAHIFPAVNIFSLGWVEIRDTGRGIADAFSIASSSP